MSRNTLKQARNTGLQLTLADLVDGDHRDGQRRSVDETRFEREQESKTSERAEVRKAVRRPEGTRVLVLAEERCGRCQRWRYPSRTKQPKHIPINPYGDCGELVVLDRRVGDVEKGEAIDLDRLERLMRSARGDVSYDALRTMAGFGCGAFVSVARAADPDAEIDPFVVERLRAAQEEMAWAS